ncbi:primosomal protein N' [Candidatus Peregrinibacteria bacterium]|nr:primosomal protein N' [Candidatus Peregrinibacteria bacterium]
MYADVVLHRRIPSRFESFTYEVPIGISVSPGQLVLVPFRKQKLAGMIIRTHNSRPIYPTKMMETVTHDILLPWQLKLVHWMAARYQTSLSKIVGLFIPEKVWPAARCKDKPTDSEGKIEAASQKPSAKVEVPPVEEALLDIVQSSFSSGEKLILEKTALNRQKFYEELSAKLPRGSQMLILFPEIFALKKFSSSLPVYHGALKEKEKAQLWMAVRDGKISAVAGTRQALFLPFKKLKHIVMDFEHNESYREKRHPPYHAAEIASTLAEMLDASLTMISGSPRVETYYRARQKKNIMNWEHGAPLASVRIINMADERKKGNRAAFAEATLEKMAKTLACGGQTLIFVNRKGEASALLCQDCSTAMRCPHCDGIFTLYPENIVRCHRCKTAVLAPAACPICRGNRLKALGIATAGLEKEIQRVFEKASTMRIEGGAASKKKALASLLNEKKLDEADIIIATQMIDKPLTLQRLALTVCVSIDHILNFPEFRAEERAWQLLTGLRLITNGDLFLQTFLPEHRVFQALANNIPEKFYEQELAARQSLCLSPFSAKI